MPETILLVILSVALWQAIRFWVNKPARKSTADDEVAIRKDLEDYTPPNHDDKFK